MRLYLLILFLSWGPIIAFAQSSQPVPIEQLKKQLNGAQHDSTRLRLCVAIGKYYYSRHQFDSLYPYIQQGMHLLSRAPSPSYASDLYFFLARYHRYRGFYQQAIAPIKQAIRYAQQAHNARQTAECQYTLAMIYSDAGEWQQAINQIGTNLKYIQDTAGLNQMLTNNYLLLIELFKELNNTPMQELYTNRFMALANQYAIPEDQMFAYTLKAELLTEHGHYREAEDLLRKALHYAHLTNTPIYIIETLNEQGINFRMTNQHQAAIRSFNQTFAMAKSINDRGAMAAAKRELAITYLAASRTKDAIPEARYAVKLARQHRTSTSVMAALECLGQVLKANGLYQEALGVYEERHRLKEAKYSEKNMQQIAQMQAQYETANKEQTIKILHKNAQINQLKVLRQQQQISQSQRTQLTNAIIITLSFLLIGVVYFSLRKSQRAYAVLQQTARELSEANEVKNKLFSIISHDLRSPIANMKTTLYLAQDTNESSLRPVVNRLKRQVDGVLGLLTNLLDWSVIQFKGFDPILEPIHLHDILTESTSQVDDLLQEKQLGIVDQVPKTHVVLGCKHQLRAIIRNILHNAIKFTPPGGYIRFHSISQDGFVELSIRDSGVGMSTEQLTKLFSAPEVRTGTMGESGTGLGLRISRELVELLGGSLLVESRPQGGTLVRIRLIDHAEQPVSTTFTPVAG